MRVRERRSWLAAHPDRISAEFEEKAWPLLRANLAADWMQRQMEETQRQLRSRYSL